MRQGQEGDAFPWAQDGATWGLLREVGGFADAEEGASLPRLLSAQRNGTGGFQLDVKVKRVTVALGKDEGGSGPPREMELHPRPREV